MRPKKYSELPESERSQSVSVLQTIAANTCNKKLSDAEFREFVINSIATVKHAAEVQKHYTDGENQNGSEK